jgi:hypothetical protein
VGYEECSVKGEVRSLDHKASLGNALHRGRAHVTFLDTIFVTTMRKARTHGPGWRTVRASSTDEKGLAV